MSNPFDSPLDPFDPSGSSDFSSIIQALMSRLNEEDRFVSYLNSCPRGISSLMAAAVLVNGKELDKEYVQPTCGNPLSQVPSIIGPKLLSQLRLMQTWDDELLKQEVLIAFCQICIYSAHVFDDTTPFLEVTQGAEEQLEGNNPDTIYRFALSTATAILEKAQALGWYPDRNNAGAFPANS